MRKFINQLMLLPVTPYVLLVLVVLAGYWQVAFMKFSLKYDMIDCYYPWRYMVGECLRNGILPLWNPYQTLGYPIHADPQSGAWYPLAWIIGYFRGYDIYALHFEYVIHLCIAAFGMFYLCKILKFDRRIGFIIAVSYVFSGFFIGNSQHFTYTISAAWIPLILAQYILIFERKKIIYSLYFGLFMFMLVAGGYPAFLFIFMYFLILLFLFYSIKLIREKNIHDLKIFVANNLIAVVVTILLSAVVLISVFSVTHFITRGGAIPLQMALFCPLSPKSLISLILPYAAIRDMGFYDTDLSMSNVYFGLIPLILFIYSLFIKKPGIYTLFIIYAFICFFAAMGKYLPVREFLYNHVPFMDMFRFPALFRLFPILFFLLTAGYGLNHIMNKEFPNKKLFFTICIFLFVILFAMLVISRVEGYLMMKDFIKNDIFKASQTSVIRQHIAFQSVVQLFFMGLFIASIFVLKNLKKFVTAIIIISIADILFASQLNAPYTVYYEFNKVAEVKEISKTFPKEFPVPKNSNVLNNNDTSGLSKSVFWKNLNTFHKQIAWDGFAPIVFKGYAYLADSVPDVFLNILSNPPVYLSSKFYHEDSAKLHQQCHTLNNKNCYLEDSTYKKLKHSKFDAVSGDTAYIESFIPEEMRVKANTKKPQLLCLLQNYYPGWSVRVNEKDDIIIPVNYGLMSVLIPSGKSEIQFKYNNKPVLTGLFITLISLFMLLLIIVIHFVYTKTHKA